MKKEWNFLQKKENILKKMIFFHFGMKKNTVQDIFAYEGGYWETCQRGGMTYTSAHSSGVSCDRREKFILAGKYGCALGTKIPTRLLPSGPLKKINIQKKPW